MFRASIGTLLLCLAFAGSSEAKVTVFFQPGFPAVESEAPSRETLAAALAGRDALFVTLEGLRQPEAVAVVARYEATP